MRYAELTPDIFKWRVNFAVHQDLVQSHLARVAARLGALLRAGAVNNVELLLAWRALDPLQQMNLVVDPNAAEIIMGFDAAHDPAQRASLSAQLEDHMAAVLRASGSDYRHPRALPWADEALVYTRNGLRLDTRGPLHHLGLANAQSPTPEQAVKYLTKIDEALQVIAKISPEALSLIENFTTTIHLRENPQRENYQSWSTHIGVGKITACNLSVVIDDVAEVIDFLVHESIHNFLHLVEAAHGPFLEARAFAEPWIQQKVVRSPWSGKSVDLGSYTHAIAVWYGLAQFWRLARSRVQGGYNPGSLSLERIEEMVRQASSGFLKGESVHLAAGPYFPYMSRDYLAFSLAYQGDFAGEGARG